MRRRLSRNRRVGVVTGALCAIAGGIFPLLAKSHLGYAADVLQGLVVGVTIALAIAFLVKFKQERGPKQN